MKCKANLAVDQVAIFLKLVKNTNSQESLDYNVPRGVDYQIRQSDFVGVVLPCLDTKTMGPKLPPSESWQTVVIAMKAKQRAPGYFVETITLKNSGENMEKKAWC